MVSAPTIPRISPAPSSTDGRQRFGIYPLPTVFLQPLELPGKCFNSGQGHYAKRKVLDQRKFKFAAARPPFFLAPELGLGAGSIPPFGPGRTRSKINLPQESNSMKTKEFFAWSSADMSSCRAACPGEIVHQVSLCR